MWIWRKREIYYSLGGTWMLSYTIPQPKNIVNPVIFIILSRFHKIDVGVLKTIRKFNVSEGGYEVSAKPTFP